MNPADAHPESPPQDRAITHDGGVRTRAGSNYGDYVPPPGRAQAPDMQPDPALPPTVAPDDPDAPLVRARRAQQLARAQSTDPAVIAASRAADPAHEDDAATARQREQSETALDNVREDYDRPSGLAGNRAEPQEQRRPGDSNPTQRER